ncbi:hypothetical protein EDC04DRAFT_2614324 [Pisolithus marmoratus]|nr:hypothetical protein EDC04DRAFT_2614324 [Pisolithus marmoratus]
MPLLRFLQSSLKHLTCSFIKFQDSAEANSQTKWLKIQALVVAKELKACNKNTQCKHDLKVKIMENDHELSMADHCHHWYRVEDGVAWHWQLEQDVSSQEGQRQVEEQGGTGILYLEDGGNEL